MGQAAETRALAEACALLNIGIVALILNRSIFIVSMKWQTFPKGFIMC